MTAQDWPRPVVDAVGDLSYSGWSRIRTCLLRAAFALDPATKHLNRGGLHAAVGNARHRLIELVADGRRDGRADPSTVWVKTQFDRLLSDEGARLAAQWFPSEVPPVRGWPDVALTKARLARELGVAGGLDWPPQEALPPRAKPPADQSQGPTPQEPPEPGHAFAEETLRDHERGFWGKIDRIENRAGTIVLVDFKSGLGASNDQLIERYRLQMLFYAGLVKAAYGVWPKVELVPVSGGAIAIEYDPLDAESVRAEAAADRTALNRAIASGGLVTSAQPSVTKCGWCPFQVVCPALLSQWPSIATPGNVPLHRAISLARGEVREVHSHHASTDVVIAQPDELTAPAGEVTVTRLPPGLLTDVGAPFAVSRVSPAGSDRVLRARWDSLIWPASNPAG